MSKLVGEKVNENQLNEKNLGLMTKDLLTTMAFDTQSLWYNTNLWDLIKFCRTLWVSVKISVDFHLVFFTKSIKRGIIYKSLKKFKVVGLGFRNQSEEEGSSRECFMRTNIQSVTG
jgi:hypothetical protein